MGPGGGHSLAVTCVLCLVFGASLVVLTHRVLIIYRAVNALTLKRWRCQQNINKLEAKVGKLHKELDQIAGKFNQSIIKSDTALRLSQEALTRAVNADIRVGGIEKSSHTLIPVPNPLADFEKSIKDITGVGKEDFNGDLRRAGMDIESPEDLV